VKTTSILRILAVLFSLSLVAGLIYYRAGGALFAKPTPAEPPPGHEDFMMGSKSAAVFLPGDEPQGVTSPSGGTPPNVLVPDDDASSFAVGTNSTGVHFEGTKSAILIRPEDIQQAQKQSTQPQSP
jgi:hypothetical protein